MCIFVFRLYGALGKCDDEEEDVDDELKICDDEEEDVDDGLKICDDEEEHAYVAIKICKTFFVRLFLYLKSVRRV
jgi:hypothetical protein